MKYTISLAFMFFFIVGIKGTSLLYSQSLQPGNIKQLKSISLANQIKDFEEGDLVLVSESKSKSKGLYPSVQIKKNDDIHFLSPDGNILKTFEEAAYKVSENNKYIAIRTFENESDQLHVYKINGTFLWKTELKVDGDMHVSPNGKYVVFTEGGTMLPIMPPAFYSKDGLLNPEMQSYEFASNSEKWFPNSVITRSAFSNDSSLVALSAYDGKDTIVFIFNDKSEITDKFKYSNNFISLIKVHPSNNNRILIKSNSKEDSNLSTFELSDFKNKSKIWKMETPIGNHVVDLSNDGSKAIIASDGNNCYLVGLASGKKLWNFSVNDNGKIRYSNAKFKNNKIILTSYQLNGPKNKLKILDFNGKLQSTIEYSSHPKAKEANNFLRFIDNKIIIHSKNGPNFINLKND